MAEEVLDAHVDDTVSEYSLFVESERFQTAAENAFIEVLTSHGKRVRLAAIPREIRSVAVKVTVLSQDIEFRPLEGGTERSIATKVETRFERSGTGDVLSRTILERASVDTLRSHTGQANRPSLLEKLAEPLIVISGAALIVYLLFTVRS